MWKFWAGVAVTAILLMAILSLLFRSIRRARGPKERDFMIRVSFWMIVFLLGLMGSILFLSAPCRYVIPALLVVLVPALVYRWTIQYQLIRKIEERAQNHQANGSSAAAG